MRPCVRPSVRPSGLLCNAITRRLIDADASNLVCRCLLGRSCMSLNGGDLDLYFDLHYLGQVTGLSFVTR